MAGHSLSATKPRRLFAWLLRFAVMLRRRRPTTPIEEALSYRFRRPELLDHALTHRSLANEKELPVHNERLEFLGDSVLGLVAGDWLFRTFPELPEGELSRLKSSLVSAKALVGYATRLGIGEHLKLGIGEERSGGRNKRSLVADGTEAVFGALYLDGGIEAVRKVIEALLDGAMPDRPSGVARDGKTHLQEIVQARGWGLPIYEVSDSSGPDHDKTFVVTCSLADGTTTRGEGRSKKAAEQAAAALALAQFEAELSAAD